MKPFPIFHVGKYASVRHGKHLVCHHVRTVDGVRTAAWFPGGRVWHFGPEWFR